MIKRGIYVLELEGGKYFVGYSRNVGRAITNNFEGVGNVWLQRNKPVRIIEMFSGGIGRELQTLLKYVHAFGSERVRGSFYKHNRPSETRRKMVEIKAYYYMRTGKYSFDWIDDAAIKYAIQTSYFLKNPARK